MGSRSFHQTRLSSAPIAADSRGWAGEWRRAVKMRTTLAAVGMVSALVAVAGTAQTASAADPTPHPPAASARVMPPYEVDTILRSMHLELLTRPVRHGMKYLARAIDRYGNEVLVAVDARIGDVISIWPLHREPRAVVYAPPPRRWGWPPARWSGRYVPEWGEPPPPPQASLPPDRLTGPQVIYAPGDAPDHAFSGKPITLPAHPPLPRARPAEEKTASRAVPVPTPTASASPQPSAATKAKVGRVELPPVTPPF